MRDAEVEVLEEVDADFEEDIDLEEEGCLTAEDFDPDDEDLTDDEDDLDADEDDFAEDEEDLVADDEDLAVDEEREFPLDCANESIWNATNADTINIAASVFADNLMIVGI